MSYVFLYAHVTVFLINNDILSHLLLTLTCEVVEWECN